MSEFYESGPWDSEVIRLRNRQLLSEIRFFRIYCIVKKFKRDAENKKMIPPPKPMPEPRSKKPVRKYPKSIENISKKPEKTVEEKSKAPPSKEVSTAPKEVPPKKVVPAPASAPPPTVEKKKVFSTVGQPLPQMAPVVAPEPEKKPIDDKLMALVEDHFYSLLRVGCDFGEYEAHEMQA